jgi:hypothetical protein
MSQQVDVDVIIEARIIADAIEEAAEAQRKSQEDIAHETIKVIVELTAAVYCLAGIQENK